MDDDYKYPLSLKSLPVVSLNPPAEATVAAHGTVASAAPSAPALPVVPLDSIEKKLIEGKVIEACRCVYDPEIPVNIHDLGLIYEIIVSDDKTVLVKMTLTAPGCPVAGSLVAEVQRRVAAIDEVADAEVQLVWDPPWSKDLMSESAQLDLGL